MEEKDLLRKVVVTSLADRSSSHNNVSEVNLLFRIVERRSGASEKDFRFELSKPDDSLLNFIYAESFSKAKYQELCAQNNLIGEFDHWPTTIIHLLNERNINLCCSLSNNSCEFVISQPISGYAMVRIPLKLAKVSGDEYICYLRSICMIYRADNEKMNSSLKSLTTSKNTTEEKLNDAEANIISMQSTISRLNAELSDNKEKIEELENDLQLEVDERFEAKEKVDLLRKEQGLDHEKMEFLLERVSSLSDELLEAREQVDYYKDENDLKKKQINQLQREKDRMQRELQETKQKLKESKKLLGNHIDNKTKAVEGIQESFPSCDLKKLTELEADLKDRQEQIDSLQASLEVSKQLYSKLEEENKKLQTTVTMYRSQSPSLFANSPFQRYSPMVNHMTTNSYTPHRLPIINQSPSPRFQMAQNLPGMPNRLGISDPNRKE